MRENNPAGCLVYPDRFVEILETLSVDRMSLIDELGDHVLLEIASAVVDVVQALATSGAANDLDSHTTDVVGRVLHVARIRGIIRAESEAPEVVG